MPAEGIQLRAKSHFMTADEIISIAHTFVELGVDKIRITGGEPLVRKDVDVILRGICKTGVDVGITTNAILLDKYIDLLKELGIRKLNISLDSLVEDTFNLLSRRADFQKIIKNIKLAIAEGFEVKINVVLIKGVNDTEVQDFVNWSFREKIDIRFIEFMPFDGNTWDWSKVVPQQEVLSRLTSTFEADDLIKLQDESNVISRNYKLKGAKGTFGFISTITNPFCDTCNRIRLTADGKIKNCLFAADELDLLKAHREGGNIESLISESIASKHKQHAGIDFKDEETMHDHRSMIAIGG
jgi:cyclic pyranopterin phosphate synthase